ncbi:MAG: ketopantoate reductase family protein [Oscillospiraceae bacterium]
MRPGRHRPPPFRLCTVAPCSVKIKEVYDDPEGVSLVWSVWKEASDVAEALGIPGIWEYMHEEMPRIVKGLGDYYPSMAQDTQAHRQTEVDSLTGAISMFGRKVGIPTPTCDILTKEIKAIQANYERQY